MPPSWKRNGSVWERKKCRRRDKAMEEAMAKMRSVHNLMRCPTVERSKRGRKLE